MNLSAEALFKILRIALGNEQDYSLPNAVDWREVMGLSYQHGVAAIAADGLQKLYEASPGLELELDKPYLEALKYEWFGNIFTNESIYTEHKNILADLASLFGKEGLKTLVLKGYASSLMYPIPEHRSAGDIDVYLYGKGEAADRLIQSYNIEVKQNKDKHSSFTYRDILVENHASFVNVAEYPSLDRLERCLEQEALMATFDETVGAFLPSPFANALLLSHHFAGHFVYGDAVLKQVLDWAVLASKYGNAIDWSHVYEIADESGYGKMLRCLNGIVVSNFGVSETTFPKWNRDLQLENRVVEELLYPKLDKHGETAWEKMLRYFRSSWKYKMVFNESILHTFFHRSWARFREKNLPNSRSVWQVNN